MKVFEKFIGIGVLINAPADGKTGRSKHLKQVILSPIADSPAAKAGILDGDRLTRVDGFDIVDDKDANDRLRGPEGSTVDVYVDRNEANLKFQIQRQKVSVPRDLEIYIGKQLFHTLDEIIKPMVAPETTSAGPEFTKAELKEAITQIIKSNFADAEANNPDFTGLMGPEVLAKIKENIKKHLGNRTFEAFVSQITYDPKTGSMKATITVGEVEILLDPGAVSDDTIPVLWKAETV